MKTIFFSMTVLLAAAALAAPKKSAYDIRPADRDAKYPTAVVWGATNDEKIAAATEESVLAEFVSSKEAAMALLSKIGTAYLGDPIALTQIAAVSQYVMQSDPCCLLFWKPSPSAGRKIWVDALLTTAETNGDEYVKTFCLDQVRWCACKAPCAIRRVALIGVKSGSKAVKQMSDMVVAELESR
ncbi:MAG: hypothetical protein J6R80_05910 [Kiritimatiellae bacterium]|nr:hypothetical protein [Kiritimatiellia bacterium]